MNSIFERATQRLNDRIAEHDGTVIEVTPKLTVADTLRLTEDKSEPFESLKEYFKDLPL